MLTVPTLPVLAYYSDVFLHDDSVAPAIWHIAITEYVVIALLRFFAAARDRAGVVARIDTQMDGNGGVCSFRCNLAFAVKSMISTFLKFFWVVNSILSPH